MCFRPPSFDDMMTKCPDCGSFNPPEADKCKKCGADLAAAKASSGTGAPGGAPNAPGGIPSAPGGVPGAPKPPSA